MFDRVLTACEQYFNYGSEYRVDALTAIRNAYSIGNYEQLQKMKWRRCLGLYPCVAY